MTQDTQLKHTLTLLVALLLSPLATLQAAAQPAAAQPNVLIILADDFGWGDMSLHGGSTPTPALDSFFKSGVELTQFMVNPVCSPTRAALLTGRHCLSTRVGPQVGHYLEKDDLTISAAFQRGGYTTGLFGKWDPAEEPDDPKWIAAAKAAKVGVGGVAPVKGSLPFGWDESTTFYTGGVHGHTRKTYGERVVSWWRNDVYAPEDEGFVSDLLMRDALNFMRGAQTKKKPFLCYLPLQLIHGPITPKPEMLAKVDPAVTDPKKRAYAAYILHLDEVIQQLEAFLAAQDLRENTAVLFFCDNGATSEGNNLPFRGTKHTIYDGGVHVPAALRWPAGLKRSGRYDGLLGATDLMPTLASMCGVTAEKPNYDGEDAWPAIRDNTASPVESCYWAWTHTKPCAPPAGGGGAPRLRGSPRDETRDLDGMNKMNGMGPRGRSPRAATDGERGRRRKAENRQPKAVCHWLCQCRGTQPRAELDHEGAKVTKHGCGRRSPHTASAELASPWCPS